MLPTKVHALIATALIFALTAIPPLMAQTPDGCARVSWKMPNDFQEPGRIAAWRLYHSPSEATVFGSAERIDIADPTAAGFELCGFSDTTVFFGLVAVDTDGRESLPSNVLSKTFDVVVDPDPERLPGPILRFDGEIPTAITAPLEMPDSEYGPAEASARFPSSEFIARTEGRWQMDVTLNSLPPTGTEYFLASRDQSGQSVPGQLTVAVNDTGRVITRLQSLDRSESIASAGLVQAGTPVTITVSFGTGGLRTFLDTRLEASIPDFEAGLDGSDLPLYLASSCWNCTAGEAETPAGTLDGSVLLRIYRSPAL